MTSQIHVLVVDDDPKFRAFAAQGLRESGLRATAVRDAREAMAVLTGRQEQPVDVVLLDVMMPETDGWNLLAELRGQGTDVPVVFVTARGEVDDRVRGLRLGADDYIVKPFSFAELLARIEAVLRRRREVREVRRGDLRLDLVTRQVRCGAVVVDLSPKEFDLLRVLIQHGDSIATRQTLLREVWQIHHDPETNVVDVYVARLRRKLEAAGGPTIATVRGRGYTMEAGS